MNDLLCLKMLRPELADLDFYDVEQEMREHRVFTEKECEELKQEPTDASRLDLMFILLESKQIHDPQIVPRFMDGLKRYYDWIVEQWDRYRTKETSLDYALYNSHRNGSPFPTHNSVSVFRKDQRWIIHKHLMSLRHGASEQRYLFIHGKIGTGKQTLVCEACADFTIVKRMNFNIFYLDLAYCNTDEATLEMLEKLWVQFPNTDQGEDRGIKIIYPSNWIEYWKRIFVRKFDKEFVDSLLVLAHVRDPQLLRHFDFKCKTVVITSNIEVVQAIAESERFLVELPKGFTEAESLELFARALKKKTTMLPSQASLIHRACQGNPFLINLIALRMSEECRNEVTIDWDQHVNNLQNFRFSNTERIRRTIGATLAQFTAEEQQYFRDLVIFRDNVPLSLGVLEMYWQLDRETTESFLSKLERRGLLEKRVCKNKLFYMMQYICYNEIKQPANADISALHRRLLERYSIREKLTHRRELELKDEFPNDDYFHFYIGYHIEQAGEFAMFEELYQDFGFLEQKLRVAGLANTVGDLRKYQDHIFPHLEDPDSMIDTLIDFLMGAECLLSDDARLLQRALNFPGDIARMAERQVDRFRNRVWFRDVAHCLETSVVKLCNRPVKVRFQDSEHVFVSLESNEIQLANLSVYYSVPPVTFKSCDGDQIKDMQTINNFLVALNARGFIKVWSTRNLPDGPDYRPNGISREAEMTLFAGDGFSSFYVLTQDNHTELIAISRTGLLCVYKVYSPIFRTDKPDIKYPTQIKNVYYLLPLWETSGRAKGSVRRCLFLAKEGDSAVGLIFNMISTSVECRFEEPPVVNVHQQGEGLLFVNKRQIRWRSTKSETQAALVYENRCGDITCSVLVRMQYDDQRYMVLGTERGISIVDIAERVEIRRMNISHSITDLDVFLLEANMLHVLLASTAKDGGNAMNLYSISLASGNQVVGSQFQLEGTTVFHADMGEGTAGAGGARPVLLHTVNRNCTLQQMQLEDGECGGAGHERSFPNENIDAHVTRLVKADSAYYLGLENGKLLKLSDWTSDSEVEEIVNLETKINYLQCFRAASVESGTISELLVVSSQSRSMVYVDEVEHLSLPDKIRCCYLLYDRFLLIIGDRCSIQIYDLETKLLELVQKEIERSYGASDCLQSERAALILCTSDGIVYHLGLPQISIETSSLTPFDELATIPAVPGRRSNEVICSCALSPDAEFLAVGCYDGRIILHMMELQRQLGVLESHKHPVTALYFSNWTDPNAPHILASVGEQIVFWSVDYLVNNQKQERRSNGVLRHSGRFPVRKTLAAPPGDANSPTQVAINRRSIGSDSGRSTPLYGSPVQRSFLGERFEESAHWYDKRGSTDKPHLLSCIKLVGRAKQLIMNRDFSKFLTVDDEGFIHYLRFYKPQASQQFLMPPPPALLSPTTAIRSSGVTAGYSGGSNGSPPVMVNGGGTNGGAHA
ncbi:uncharacterized protein LOC118464233 [Anopheles albimanus]|uniref:APAF-1 helical domain-containing protein n=1 Tax=Anopheles albimanus TaxID=7167 RepID=A0A182FUD0_ANOAL|nr:uncharacterized protein LOC118464233 [Anopheles albimanus]XP_035787307.1 uncharacterized protein LOC118464233 [Anopheles albimanus]XP_035787308.1 uncharacterized protein LOC118464233 [Anopheles albimanus]XP_035787309.1 uncharacterized protein LOC118464233 [Anopheles albimanus]